MKPRIRPIRSLFHRWGISLGLTSHEVGAALVQAGLIEYTPHDPSVSPTHYIETARLRSSDNFERLVRETLMEYKAQHGL